MSPRHRGRKYSPAPERAWGTGGTPWKTLARTLWERLKFQAVCKLLTVCLVMMSPLLLIQPQPLIQKGARHFQRKER